MKIKENGEEIQAVILWWPIDNRRAQTVGRQPDIDVAFQYLKFFFEEDDAALEEVRRGYIAGDILSGELKQMTIDKAAIWLTELAELRRQNAHLVNEFLARMRVIRVLKLGPILRCTHIPSLRVNPVHCSSRR